VFTTLQRILAAMGSDLRDLAALEEPTLSSKQIDERLRRFGLDKSLISRLSASSADQPERILDRLERIFRWSPTDLAGEGTLPLRPSPAFAGRFKQQRRKEPAQAAYVVYAHYLAMLAAQAAAGLPVADLPKDPHEIRKEVIERYGGLRFEQILQWTWDHGIPVVPLFDPGKFHGACWVISGRPVICLKQRTPFEARWAFDLGHETGHVSRHLSAALPAVLELGEITPFGDAESTASDEQEEEASEFAGELLLGNPEALAERVVEVARGKVEWLKQAVATVATEAGVETDALANYIAYRLSRQGFNDWWGVATNLQEAHQEAPEIARRELLERLDFDALADDDRDLLQAALVAED
jgi:Zn-dependent peptidase ImmA (M78 family)